MRFQNAEKLLKNYIKQAKWNYTKTKPPQGLAPYTAVKMNPYLLDKVQVHYNKKPATGNEPENGRLEWNRTIVSRV